jgi:DNA-binding transcriptional MocR family regulator
VQTSAQKAAAFAASGLVDSGGGLNQFTSNLVRVALEGGGQKDYLDELRRAYRQRVAAMDAALHKHIGDRATWTVPAGGFFFWLTCAEQNLPAAKRPADGVGSGQIDTTALLQTAASAKVGFLPGSRCSSVGGLGNCLRLCFAHYDIAAIEEGIRRLGHVFDSVQ